MLQSMRDGAKSWVIKSIFMGLLVMATAGLVLMDIGNFFTGNLPQATAFEVEGTSFKMNDLDRLVTQALQQNNLTLAQGIQAGIVNVVINNEIQKHLLAKEAQRLDISISDEIVAKQTKALLDTFIKPSGEQDQDNSELRTTLFQRLLMQAGMSESQYVAMQKHDIASTLVSSPLSSTATIPNDLKDILLKYNAEMRDADTYYITVSKSELPSVDEDTLKAFYEENKEGYRVPEYRRFDVASLTLDNVQKSISIADEMIEAEYKDRIRSGDYQTPEMRLLAQVSLSSREEADKVLEKAKSLKNLQKALKDVTGSDAAYVKAEKYDASSLPEEISKDLFSNEKTGLMGPYETALGWFVMDVKKVFPKTQKPLADVKDEIEADLRYTKAADSLYDLSYALEDALTAGEDLDTVAKEMKLDMKRVSFVDNAGNALNKKDKNFNDKTMKASTEVLDAVFQAGEGAVTPLLENSAGDFLVAHIHEVKESYIPKFSDIKKDVRADWNKKEKARIAREKAEEFMTLVAKDQKRPKFKSHKNIHRLEFAGDLSKQKLNTLAVTALFQLDKINEMTAIPYKDGQLVVRYKGSSLSLPKKESSAFVELKGSIDRDYTKTILTDYFTELKKNLDITINEEAIANFYSNRLSQQ